MCLAEACTTAETDGAAPGTETTAVSIDEIAPVEVADGGYVVGGVAEGAGSEGDLVAATEIHSDWVPAGARAWRVLYRSMPASGGSGVVSGVVVRPGGERPDDGFPVLSWGHGTTGIADECAPSLRDSPPVPFLEGLLDAGWVVAATDYEGLGTPGVHPYLVGSSAARSVLDAARAARSAGGGEQVVVAGHSQGGHAALWAGELAGSYSPELDLRGVVASAPAAELVPLLRHAQANPIGLGYVAMAAVSYDALYADIDVTEVMTNEGLAAISIIEEECAGGVLAAFAGIGESALRGEPLEIEAVVRRMEENTPGRTAPAAPVLVVQGDADTIVPAPSTDRFVQRLCDANATVQYDRYDGHGHSSVVAESWEAVLMWINARIAGEPASSTC